MYVYAYVYVRVYIYIHARALVWSLYRYCFLVTLCMSYLRQASLRDSWHCTSSYHPCDLTVPNYYFEERRCCSLVRSSLPLSFRQAITVLLCLGLLFLFVCWARAHSKQARIKDQDITTGHRYIDVRCYGLALYSCAPTWSLYRNSLSAYCFLVHLCMSYLR